MFTRRYFGDVAGEQNRTSREKVKKIIQNVAHLYETISDRSKQILH